MDHLYARLKRLQKEPYRKVISGERIFDESVPPPSSCYEYDPRTILDANEWFKVSNFSKKPYFPDELTSWAPSVDFSELKKTEFQNITYLLAVQEENFHFQRVRPSAILRKKVIVCGDITKLEKPSDKIVLNLFPDAVYFVADDALVFRELAAISSVFRGIDELFTEATDDQVQDFLSQEFVDAAIEVSKVSKPNRKRIALAVETLGKMTESERDDVFVYISKYTASKISFSNDEKTFKVSSDDELKLLLYGIEQRFYTTTVGAEDRIANSVAKFDS